MKFISTFTILAFIGLGQAHQFPDFGSGPLHEDIQDFLDLVPAKEINKIGLDYMLEDPEVKAVLKYLLTTTILKDLMVNVEAVPEFINLINYMQKEGVDIYFLVNEVNKALGIDELVPPISYSYSAITQRTGGLAGFFKDVKKLIPFGKFIRTYVQKMKTSSAFSNFISQLKSDNFQQLVNKMYQIDSFRIIINGLKIRGVNTQIVADIMYIVLGISVPNDVSFNNERTLKDELMDFAQLIPMDNFLQVIVEYMDEDQKVQNGALYMFTPEFHLNLRSVEALKEYQALVMYLEEAGLNIIDYIKTFHKIINMEDYVPPKIETTFESQIGMEKVGNGMKEMIEDLYDVLPVNEIDALYEQKLHTSKIFADFVEKLTSPEMQKIINNLYGNLIYKNFIMTSRENELELQELIKLTVAIFGLKY